MCRPHHLPTTACVNCPNEPACIIPTRTVSHPRWSSLPNFFVIKNSGSLIKGLKILRLLLRSFKCGLEHSTLRNREHNKRYLDSAQTDPRNNNNKKTKLNLNNRKFWSDQPPAQQGSVWEFISFPLCIRCSANVHAKQLLTNDSRIHIGTQANGRGWRSAPLRWAQ